MSTENHLVVEQPERVFALKFAHPQAVCHVTTYQTELPDVMVVEDVGAGFYFQAVENESHLFTDTLNYFNSKIV